MKDTTLVSTLPLMVGLIPYLIIQSPNGTEETFELRDISYNIGRLPDNHIALTEDPDNEISRIKHCVITREEGLWMLCDYSTNGTEVELDGTREYIHNSKIPMQSEAVIHIGHWRLRFRDPNATQKSRRRANSSSPSPVAVPSQGKFIYVVDHEALYYQSPDQNLSRQYIKCRPQVQKMLQYMARKKRDQGNPMATYEELKKFDPGILDSLQIHGLARELRNIFTKYSPTSDRNELLVTVSGEGYVLNIECE